jgi:hypothetical protein
MNPRAFLFGDVPDFFARLSASRLICRFFYSRLSRFTLPAQRFMLRR